MVNEELLLEAQQASGQRTYSATVNKALEAYVRRARSGRIFELRGSGLWDGDLGIMRDDRLPEDG